MVKLTVVINYILTEEDDRSKLNYFNLFFVL